MIEIEVARFWREEADLRSRKLVDAMKEQKGRT